MYRVAPITLSIAVLFAMSACSESTGPEQTTNSETTPVEQASIHAWVLTSAPQGDVSVTEAKLSAKEGDQVVIRGRIGGRHQPMSPQSPVFTIVDLDLEYCGQYDDDECGTPWDYCCETRSTIASNSATVQVQGNTIDLSGAGLKPLDEVVLIGTVAPRPDDQVLVVRATGVYNVGG